MAQVPPDDKKREKEVGEERIYDEDLLVRHIDDFSILQCNKCGRVVGIMERKNFYFYARMTRNCSHLLWEAIDREFAESKNLSFEILTYHAIFVAISRRKFYLLYKISGEEDGEEENSQS